MKFILVLITLLLSVVNSSAGEIASASGSTGVAPFAVFFNVAVNESTPTVQNFHNYHYVWDFDDPTSGTWDISGKSKNEAIGPVAAHVFETPGTYTVTATGTDGTDESFEITVTDPDNVFAGNLTTCIGDTTHGSSTGCPSGATYVSTDNIQDISAYSAPGKRVLFQRGSSWSTTGTVSQGSGTGESIIGAYGTCADEDDKGLCSNAPAISGSSVVNDQGVFEMVNGQRFMDLKVTSPGSTGCAIYGITNVRNTLTLRVQFTAGFWAPYEINHWRNSDADLITNNFLVSSDIGPTGGYGIYAGSERIALLGNTIHDAWQSHVVRNTQSYLGVIQHNDISGASVGAQENGHALKLHGPSETIVGDYAATGGGGLTHRTKFVVISDNIIGQAGPWPISIGPQNGTEAENVSDVIFERNKYISEHGTYSLPVEVGIMFEGRYITVRNNIVDMSGNNVMWTTGISIGRRGIEDTPLGNRIYNNTIYSSVAMNDLAIGIDVDATADDTIVRNNLVSFPNATGTETLIRESSGNAVVSNNLNTDTPYFSDADNVSDVLRDFSITSSSTSAIDQGYTVPVFEDFIGSARSAPYDIGAYAYVSPVTGLIIRILRASGAIFR